MNKPLTGVGTVGKAMEVLDVIAHAARPLRFREIQARCNFPKATLYRFLQMLSQQGLLHYQDTTRCYGIGLRLVELAHVAWQQSSLAPIAHDPLRQLATYANETVHLAQLEAGQVLFIDKIQTSKRYETLAQTGKVAPAHCTGVGKAILAYLPDTDLQEALKHQTYASYTPNTHQSSESLMAELDDIRTQTVAYDRQEHEIGIISIAAPIISDYGQVLGAASIVTSINRHSLDSLTQYKADLLKTTKQIGQAASAWQFPQSEQE